MFIVQQKREEIKVVETDNRQEKKKKKKDLIGNVDMVARCRIVVRSNHAFLLFFLLVFVLAETSSLLQYG